MDLEMRWIWRDTGDAMDCTECECSKMLLALPQIIHCDFASHKFRLAP